MQSRNQRTGGEPTSTMKATAQAMTNNTGVEGGKTLANYAQALPRTDGKPHDHIYEVVAVRHDSNGNISDFQLDDGTEVDYANMLKLVNNGQVIGVEAVQNQTGAFSIRSRVDGDPDNNLSNLPTF